MNLHGIKESILEEYRERLKGGEDIRDLEDSAHETADSYTPIYDNEVIKAWQEMPSEYDNRAAEEGLISEYNIIKQMQADLYLCILDIVNEVVSDLDNFACSHSDDWQGAECVTCGLFVKACCGVADESGNSYCADCSTEKANN